MRMKNNEGRVEFLFDLEVNEDWPPVAKECLILSRTIDGYRVEVSPFFLGGISVGDVLEIDDDGLGNALSWTHVKKSERSTVWVMFLGEHSYADEMSCLQELGCNVEELKRFRYISIDVPDASLLDKVDACFTHLNESQVGVAYPSLREEEQNSG